MTESTTLFGQVLDRIGSSVIFHREDGGTACPCLTPEGFRDPGYHRAHPEIPTCNEQGYLVTATQFTVKASIQPAMTKYVRQNQRANDLLGDVLTDDKLGIFPCRWGGNVVDFDDWSEAGEDYIVYDGKRYTVVSADKLADVDGDPNHHWEVGLRLMKPGRPNDA